MESVYSCTYKDVGINMHLLYEYAHIWAWVIPTFMQCGVLITWSPVSWLTYQVLAYFLFSLRQAVIMMDIFGRTSENKLSPVYIQCCFESRKKVFEALLFLVSCTSRGECEIWDVLVVKSQRNTNQDQGNYQFICSEDSRY